MKLTTEQEQKFKELRKSNESIAYSFSYILSLAKQKETLTESQMNEIIEKQMEATDKARVLCEELAQELNLSLVQVLNLSLADSGHLQIIQNQITTEESIFINNSILQAIQKQQQENKNE